MTSFVSPPSTTESGDERWAMVLVDEFRCVVVVVVVTVELWVASMDSFDAPRTK